jgi:hypothetical protein
VPRLGLPIRFLAQLGRDDRASEVDDPLSIHVACDPPQDLDSLTVLRREAGGTGWQCRSNSYDAGGEHANDTDGQLPIHIARYKLSAGGPSMVAEIGYLENNDRATLNVRDSRQDAPISMAVYAAAVSNAPQPEVKRELAPTAASDDPSR